MVSIARQIEEFNKGETMGTELGWELAAVMAGLLLFGVGYDWLVTRLEERGHDQGYTSLLVVGGVLITLAGAGLLVGWWTVAVISLCFTASGTPMIVGSVCRYARERRQDEEAARLLVEENLDDGA